MKKSRFWQAQCHKASLWLFPVVILAAFDIFAAEIIHHELHVSLRPADAGIIVTDSIQLPPGTASAEFSLRNSLTVKADGVELILIEDSGTGRLHHYRINRLPADGKVQLSYRGRIVADRTEDPFDMPESVLNTENLYLDSSSGWLPDFRAYPLFTFNLHVAAPRNWQMISQGARLSRNSSKDSTKDSDRASGKNNTGDSIYLYHMPQPQDNIYLLGGHYQRYARQHEGIEIVVYLFEDDNALAEKYLQTSADYISLYSDWIGRYPYDKFAVVENRWQTGYGMPSFTLLGSRVIRLPFILNTSLPHEILHNWWGNGVYIDFSKGNWSEGLTAYMSDHYSNEQQGKGSVYRRKALERYANFAARQADFALADFRSRHDEASEAIGYSKSLMIFHMLRTLAGDEAFNDGIRKFWQRYQYNYASFSDLIGLLYPAGDNSSGTQDDISPGGFSEQWLNRTGAPEISLDNVSTSKLDDGYLLSIKISQQQQDPAYILQIPLEIKLQAKTQVVRETVTVTRKSQLFTFKLQQQPLTITLDPDYDVFRLLHANELPASLGRLFGSKKQLLVIPASATAEQIEAWQQLASAWSGQYNNVELRYDNQDVKQMKAADDDTAIWLLGWNNRLLNDYRKYFTAEYPASTSPALSQKLSGDMVTIDKQPLPADKHAVVLLDADNTRRPLAFIGAEDPRAIALLARKLPHYKSYGQLVFELPEVNNIIKHHLPVLKSPMVWSLDEYNAPPAVP